MSLASASFLASLLGDREISTMLGTEAGIAAMLRFETALARSEASVGLVSADAASAIAAACRDLVPDMPKLRESTLRDGVVVPELVRQLRLKVGEPHDAAVHFGATSQDVIDTALALKLAPVLDLIESRLMKLLADLDALVGRFGDAPLMGRTRMQAAVPITAGHRLRTWRSPIQRLIADLPRQRDALLILTLAGAAGTAEKFGDKITAVRSAMATELGLGVPDYVPHSDRGRMVDFASFLSLVTGALGKIGQDIALMAQTGIDEIALSGGGGSSAMPHKKNPVAAEVLVTLARYNATLLSGMHQALIHEQERSGAAWTLEWIILPQMVEATGCALSHGTALLSSVESISNRQ
ncbi:3-carboxy-cis,cis-muconate cycloisomerase [Rhizobiaceae bacterium n13]|uniref:3-carboxy-cis,cis-muconate cycloisomerase n=1 Tax=Ferirhizobium litorale TaxID=2927786 RepID=A0AAE3QDY4_9HYPH|nr:3-carboxy-cis,cis-muconate cycloisomerase [Fererhizobium litorale]MDI7862886.1 3-carboxy-cis,cis-muconate cycloisomerase [Fererhizobium litorale]MDI7923972.1 3-carboxy-cis,cis-muconate cycloisomerase [Fererhizobium litorale]